MVHPLLQKSMHLLLPASWVCGAHGAAQADILQHQIGIPVLASFHHTCTQLHTHPLQYNEDKKNKKKNPRYCEWEIAWWFGMQQEVVLICPWSPKYPDTRHAPVDPFVGVWCVTSCLGSRSSRSWCGGSWDIHLLHLPYKTLPAETRWIIHWIGLRENFNRKAMGFYHQI